jgi:replication fork protection complex subunit Tof1/Swi1
MERSKIRDTDNLRTFYLARFFIEFLLLVRQKAADSKEKEKQNGHANGHGELAANDELALGLVADLAEMDSVRWVFARLRLTMEDRVGFHGVARTSMRLTRSSLQRGTSFKRVWNVLPKS